MNAKRSSTCVIPKLRAPVDVEAESTPLSLVELRLLTLTRRRARRSNKRGLKKAGEVES